MNFVKLAVGAAAWVALLALPAAAENAPKNIDDWPAVLEKAKQEGSVVVHGAPGRRYARVLKGAFEKKYPGIRVEFSGARNRTAIPRLLRERQAGIFKQDVWTSGSSAIAHLKPAGAFQPIRPFLRKEIMADKNWIGGFNAGFTDYEGKYFYSYDGSVQHPIHVNWDIIKKDQLKSIKDLIKPEFAGKIVWDDPRVGGSGNGSSLTIDANFGEGFLRQLYAQKAVFTTNRRQGAEWIVRGRYPIAIGLDKTQLEIFVKEGLGKNIKPLPDSYYKVQQISPGFGSAGVMDKAPHPHAAAVYLNWLLSKEGQEAWVAVPRNSRRTDVTSPDPSLAPNKGVTYFNGHHEKNRDRRAELQKIAQKVIDAPPPKKRKKRRRGKKSSKSK